MTPSNRLSHEFGRLAETCQAQTVTLRALVPAEDARAHALITMLLSICFLHPVPMPGVSMFFGTLILIAGTRMALRTGLWVPERWLDKPLPAKGLRIVFGAGQRLALRADGFLRPRMEWLVSHGVAARAHGCAIAVCGLLLLIPLPPPTNFPPATAALLLAVAILERDALVLALGYLALALNLVFFGAIALFGWQGVRALF